MNILCVYVDGGKGHYIPAKAVAEQLKSMGHNVDMIDFFALLNLRPVGRINKFIWRKLLERPDFENRFSSRNDQDTREIRLASSIIQATRKRRFRKIIRQYRPDMIFTTHPYPGYMLSDLAARLTPHIPVTYYATDVFCVPMSAVNNHLESMYVSTEEGCDSAIKNGQMADKVKLCPFPLQASCQNSRRMTKAEARTKLGLKQGLFTLQINFGGEGVGSFALLEGLRSISSPMQIIIIGGLTEKTEERLNRIKESLPDHIEVHIPGFVSNVNDYVLASDIVAGRSGINTLVECFYLHRPFLITELVYTVMASAEYVEKYGVGWNMNHDLDSQLSLIANYAKNPLSLDFIDHNFDMIPIEYDAAKLARMIVEDARKFKELWRG